VDLGLGVGLGTNHDSGVAATPRRSHIHQAGWRTIGQEPHHANGHHQGPLHVQSLPVANEPAEQTSSARAQVPAPRSVEPFQTLQRAFSSQGPLDYDILRPLLERMERLALPAGATLFVQGAPPTDGLYVVQSGVLRATYLFQGSGISGIGNGVGSTGSELIGASGNGRGLAAPVVESMVPGTLAGELSALAGEPRNATVVAERDAVVWRLSGGAMAELEALERKGGEAWGRFVKMVLKGAAFCFGPSLLRRRK
jgi:CRP-like cAMP-binding protein